MVEKAGGDLLWGLWEAGSLISNGDHRSLPPRLRWGQGRS